jgi:hypothetical protein
MQNSNSEVCKKLGRVLSALESAGMAIVDTKFGDADADDDTEEEPAEETPRRETGRINTRFRT